jgi:CheY-like chemotaxis protein
MNGCMARVLVVEDEVLVRWMVLELVAEAGLSALEAENADAALRLLETDGPFDVLFTDVHMPGSMDGFALARAVREKWPTTHIIIASGHSGAKSAAEAGAERFFAKPYNAQAVIEALQSLSGHPH